jgi:predicted AlkP superfamily phosphohydrolase/phosphomutase
MDIHYNENMKKRMVWMLPVIGLIMVFGFFYFRGSSKKPAGPVVLIGLDGADWNIIHPLFERGKLPYLQTLVQEGSWGVLQTDRPTKSPVIWTSIASGMTMVKHGILDYRYVTENNIEIPYSAGERRVKTFWNILGEEGYTVGIINWFVTFPAEEVNGFLVSDRFRLGVYKYLPEKEITFPEELKDTLFSHVVMFKDQEYKKILRDEGLKDFWSEGEAQNVQVPEGRERQVKNFRIYVLQDKSIENISLFLLENISVDLFATYFRLIDTTSHFTSIYIDEDLRKRWVQDNERFGGPAPETERALYQNMATIVEPVYSYLDSVVGRIMEKSAENTTFILVSDHGFTFSTQGYGHYETPKLANGIILIKGPEIKPDYQLEKATIYDVMPTILYLFDLPVGEDMDGHVLLQAFRDSYSMNKQVRFVPTHGSYLRQEQAKKPRDLDKEVLEDLRSLGYIK